jgi:hypothetical protein
LLAAVAALSAPTQASAATPVPYYLPWVGGQSTVVTTPWYQASHVGATAYDFKPNQEGLPVVAVADGTVTAASYTNKNDVSLRYNYTTNTCATGTAASQANYVYIKHADGTESEYSHLKTVLVANGQKVFRGQIIGIVGKTGCATGTHIHFQFASKTYVYHFAEYPSTTFSLNNRVISQNYPALTITARRASATTATVQIDWTLASTYALTSSPVFVLQRQASGATTWTTVRSLASPAYNGSSKTYSLSYTDALSPANAATPSYRIGVQTSGGTSWSRIVHPSIGNAV